MTLVGRVSNAGIPNKICSAILCKSCVSNVYQQEESHGWLLLEKFRGPNGTSRDCGLNFQVAAGILDAVYVGASGVGCAKLSSEDSGELVGVDAP